jgi:uncharacterized protein (TIGR01777 family)
MKILISGSTGFVGSALSKSLQAKKHHIYRLIRSPRIAHKNDILWNPREGYIDKSKITGFDALIHLAGENIAARWTKAKKKRIYESRVHTTKLLALTLAQLTNPPKVFICASAIGYYGDRADEILTEQSTSGKGFLAGLCRDWEEAAEPARNAGIRTVHLRFGIILHPTGGALKKMLPLFKLGLAGPIGNGTQYWSWITLEDTVAAIEHILKNPSITGPVNIVSPNPVTNKEFIKTLAYILKRPAFLPAPKFLLKLALGQFAQQTLIASTRAKPEKLLQTEFYFKHPGLETALRAILIASKNQPT